MSCFNLQAQNTCTDDNEFDAQCDYNSKYPFKWIDTPPKGSKLTKSYKDYQCIYDFKLTWKQYVDAQTKNGSEISETKPIYPDTDIISDKLNHTKNPVNISYGDLASKYDSKNSETKADTQRLALFTSLKNGLGAAFELYYKKYNGKNLCQMSANHQGDYKLDGSPKGFNDCNAARASRLIWVKNVSNSSKISPTKNLNLNNKNTLFALVYGMTIAENGSKLSEATIEEGYKIYKQKNNIT